MGALLDDGRQRLRAAADGALSARARAGSARDGNRRADPDDAFGRQSHDDRYRLPLSDPPGRERPGRRRHILGERRPRKRAGTGAFVRHGRNHGQGLPDRRLCAAGLPQLRGGSGRPLQEGLGPAAAHSRHRYGRDRRRRRQSRGSGRARADRGRAGKRGRRSGTRQLRQGRRTARGHRREFAARPLRSRTLRWRQPRSSTSAPRRRRSSMRSAARSAWRRAWRRSA